MSKLAAFIADVLTRKAADLGARWQVQARSVAPRPPEQGAWIDAGEAERLVQAVAAALRVDARAHDAVMRAGWDFGAAAHLAGLSLHYMLKELDLLLAMVLYAGERALAEGAPADSDAADGIGVARRVQQAFSLLTLASSKGFTHAYLARLQDEYRDLRHELRNPLGTIKSAVALMEDESVPPELRNSPRFRAMVVRNAMMLDAVISERLSDSSTLVPAFGRQEVSLRDIALTVRRTLREEAAEEGGEIVVGDSLPTVFVDSIWFELALKSVVTAALHASPPGSAVGVDLREQREGSAVIAVTFDEDDARAAGHGLGGGALDFARELLARSGGGGRGRVWREARGVCLEVPTSAAHAEHDVARAG